MVGKIFDISMLGINDLREFTPLNHLFVYPHVDGVVVMRIFLNVLSNDHGGDRTPVTSADNTDAFHSGWGMMNWERLGNDCGSARLSSNGDGHDGGSRKQKELRKDG